MRMTVIITEKSRRVMIIVAGMWCQDVSVMLVGVVLIVVKNYATQVTVIIMEQPQVLKIIVRVTVMIIGVVITAQLNNYATQVTVIIVEHPRVIRLMDVLVLHVQMDLLV